MYLMRVITIYFFSSRLSLAGDQSQCSPVPPGSTYPKKIIVVKEGIHGNGTSTLLHHAIKITCNMYIYFYMVRFRVSATGNRQICSVHINNHKEISCKTKWSLSYTRINYTHSYHTYHLKVSKNVSPLQIRHFDPALASQVLYTAWKRWS
jgi:hypothetical protein